MARIRWSNSEGVLGVLATDSAVTLSSPEFEDRLPAIFSPDIASITLDPGREHGEPEIVHVVSHTASSGTVTVIRARDTSTGGGPARVHPAGTRWVHAPTPADFAASSGGGIDVSGGIPGAPIVVNGDVDGVIPSTIEGGNAFSQMDFGAAYQVRRDTTANWISEEAYLEEGEFGYSTDTREVKIGNSSPELWSSMPAINALSGLIDVDLSTPQTDGQAVIWDELAETWKPGTVSGSGAAGVFELDLTSEPPGAVAVDLSATPPTAATAMVFLPTGDCVVTVTPPSATDRGPLDVVLAGSGLISVTEPLTGGTYPLAHLAAPWIRYIPITGAYEDPPILYPESLIRSVSDRFPGNYSISAPTTQQIGLSPVEVFTLDDTVTFAANPGAPATVTHVYTQGSGAPYTPAYSVTVVWADGAPSWSTVDGKVDAVRYTRLSPEGDMWMGEVIGLDITP